MGGFENLNGCYHDIGQIISLDVIKIKINFGCFGTNYVFTPTKLWNKKKIDEMNGNFPSALIVGFHFPLSSEKHVYYRYIRKHSSEKSPHHATNSDQFKKKNHPK